MAKAPYGTLFICWLEEYSSRLTDATPETVSTDRPRMPSLVKL